MAKMVKCKVCGEEIAKTAKSCPKCGAERNHIRYGWIVFLLVVAIGAVITIVDGNYFKATVSESKYASMSEADVRSGSASIIYEDVARNPDNFKGSLITFTGEVIQVMEGSSTVVLRINQDNPDELFASDTWYVTYKPSKDAAKILDGDMLAVYGECTGTKTYETVLGSTMTIPSMTLLYYDLLK